MLHPQARALIDQMAERGIPPTHMLDPEEARRLYRERRSFTQPEPQEVARLENLSAPGPAGGTIPLRFYAPSVEGGKDRSSLLPVLVYFHGGGWVIGDLDTHDTLCRQLANEAGCAVISVDYRLAPEHRFPAAVDDCIAATRWVAKEAARLGLDASRIAVGGDSAGGNLAAVVAIALRDEPGVLPHPLRFQLLIYPATDMRRCASSHSTNGEGYVLTRDSINYYHAHYMGDASRDMDWRASPLLHKDLTRLPPALVVTAGYDPLRDEGTQYAQRLSESGNRATLVSFERMIHGFVLMGKVLDEAEPAVGLCALELRRALA